MTTFNKIKADYKQYGFRAFLKHIIKFGLRKIGLDINSYYYMVAIINAEQTAKQLEAKPLSNVKELGFDDFLKGDKDVFNKDKLALIKERLADGCYCAYGVFDGDHLIYSCWLSYKRMDLPINQPEELLYEEALLVDDYCSPQYRGKGIHTAMNAYRLWRASLLNKKRAIVIIMKDNAPAYKSQVRVGFRHLFVFTVVNVWGKVYTDYFKKKQKYCENDN